MPPSRTRESRSAPALGPCYLLKGRPPEPFGGSRGARLPACLAISFPVFRTCRPPGRGRRVRYGELRSPSCTPFHPPGAPLPWLSYLLGPRSGPVDFQGKSTRATSRSASATTTFLRALHVLEGGLQALCFREKSFAPPAHWARLSAAKGRAVARRVVCLADVRGARGCCARNAKGERWAAGSGASR